MREVFYVMGVENTNLKLTKCAMCDEGSASADGSTFVNLIGHGEPPAKTGFQRIVLFRPY